MQKKIEFTFWSSSHFIFVNKFFLLWILNASSSLWHMSICLLTHCAYTRIFLHEIQSENNQHFWGQWHLFLCSLVPFYYGESTKEATWIWNVVPEKIHTDEEIWKLWEWNNNLFSCITASIQQMTRCAVPGNPRVDLLGSLPSSAFSQFHEGTTSFGKAKIWCRESRVTQERHLHPEEVSISVNWIFTYLSEGLVEWGCSGAKADSKTGFLKHRGFH